MGCLNSKSISADERDPPPESGVEVRIPEPVVGSPEPHRYPILILDVYKTLNILYRLENPTILPFVTDSHPASNPSRVQIPSCQRRQKVSARFQIVERLLHTHPQGEDNGQDCTRSSRS